MSNDYVCLIMPFPPSVNNLYGGGKQHGGGKQCRYRTKRYDKWIQLADLAISSQGPFTQFVDRVDIVVHLGGGRSDSDCDNFNKAPIDRLVKHGIIKDDCKPYVRSVKAVWADDVKGCMVEVSSV